MLGLDEQLGSPVDSYVNGSQTWLVGDEDKGELILEFRLHPVAGYRTPNGSSHYDVWETVVSQLSKDVDPQALRIGDEVRPLTSMWDGPAQLAALTTAALGRAPDHAGLVDHRAIGDAWERANGNVSIIALVLDQLGS